MRALTLYQPWATLVARGEKLVENRPWRAAPAMMGRRFAIHAGKTYDAKAVGWIEERLGRPVPDCLPLGAVVGVATLVGCVQRAADVAGEQAKWFIGPYGFILADVIEIAEPINCRGALSFWHLPPDVDDAVVIAADLARDKRKAG